MNNLTEKIQWKDFTEIMRNFSEIVNDDRHPRIVDDSFTIILLICTVVIYTPYMRETCFEPFELEIPA